MIYKMEKAYKKNALMFSIKNTIMLLFMVGTVMGLHIWIVCKALSVLGDVTTVIVVNHGRRALNWPDDSIYLLNWDKHLDTKRYHFRCCASPNCKLTKDRNYFGEDYKYFDAMLFSEKYLESTNRPNRSINMLNIFISMQPDIKNVVCDDYYDDFFNLTFTYRLDSDLVWKYFIVRSLSRDIIAPSLSPAWNRSLSPVPQDIKSIIKGKTKSVAYIDSCGLANLTQPYISDLQKKLEPYSIKIYRYNCSNTCGKIACNRIFKNEYMFYILFEDIFAEDYVTMKILHAYAEYVVPIIYGGANYTR